MTHTWLIHWKGRAVNGVGAEGHKTIKTENTGDALFHEIMQCVRPDVPEDVGDAFIIAGAYDLGEDRAEPVRTYEDVVARGGAREES
jgi:hypothetical protein